jgi:hypothetical protein
MPDTDTDLIDSVVRGIRRRASFARISALIMVSILTLIGIGAAVAFVQAQNGPTMFTAHVGGTRLVGSIDATTGVQWVAELTGALIRIAGVIMAVFLINILVSFARYNLRVANYLDSRADVLEVTRGNVEHIAALLASISVDPLDFIKTPMSPFDTYLSMIRGVLPGRTVDTAGPKSEV